MKTVSCLLLLVCSALAQRRQGFSNSNDIPIISYVNDNNYDGTYVYSYETGNGIQVQEQGSLKNPGTDQEAQTARGSYSYTAPDGQVITVNWYADETGFHAEGAHLPTPPPVPSGLNIGGGQGAGGRQNRENNGRQNFGRQAFGRMRGR